MYRYTMTNYSPVCPFLPAAHNGKFFYCIYFKCQENHCQVSSHFEPSIRLKRTEERKRKHIHAGLSTANTAGLPGRTYLGEFRLA